MFKRLLGGGNSSFYLELIKDKSPRVSQPTSIIDDNSLESLDTGLVEKSFLEVSKPILKANTDSGTTRKKTFR